MVGNCDSGYSCAYSNSISWRGPTTPMPPEINPRAVFERLFGDGDTTDPAARAALARQNRSILDFVRDDTARLDKGLGQTDRRKLDEYLDAIRDIEMRIQKAEQRGFDQSLPADGTALGHPADVRRSRQADVRPAGDGFPGRPDPRDHLHDRARGQQPDLSRRSASPRRTTDSRITRTIPKRSKS